MVRSAIVNDPWVLLVLDSGRVVVFRMNSKTKDMDVHPQMSNVNVIHSQVGSNVRVNMYVVLFSGERKRIFCPWKWPLDRIHWQLIWPHSSERGTKMMIQIYTASQRRRIRHLVESQRMKPHRMEVKTSWLFRKRRNWKN